MEFHNNFIIVSINLKTIQWKCRGQQQERFAPPQSEGCLRPRMEISEQTVGGKNKPSQSRKRNVPLLRRPARQQGYKFEEQRERAHQGRKFEERLGLHEAGAARDEI